MRVLFSRGITLSCGYRSGCNMISWFGRLLLLTDILRDPGAVSRAGRKGATKVFKHRRKSPWYRLSPDHFQTVKRMLAPDWAQKMLCIMVPNRRIVSPEFFQNSVSSYATAIFSPQLPGSFTNCFLTRNEDTTDELKNVSDAISWSNSICTEKIVSEGSQCILNNRKFKMQQRRDKTTILHVHPPSRFFVHFFAFTARLPRENA